MEHDNEPVDFHKLGGIVSKAKKAGNSYSGKDIDLAQQRKKSRLFGLSQSVCSRVALRSKSCFFQ